MNDEPVTIALLEDESTPCDSHGIAHLESHNRVCIIQQPHLQILRNELVKGWLRASGAMPNRSENLFEIRLDRSFAVESSCGFGDGKENRGIVSEAVDKVRHVEVFECVKESLHSGFDVVFSSRCVCGSGNYSGEKGNNR